MANRFTRQAPVIIPEGYFIMCPLNHSLDRITFVMCLGRRAKGRCSDEAKESKSCVYRSLQPPEQAKNPPETK